MSGLTQYTVVTEPSLVDLIPSTSGEVWLYTKTDNKLYISSFSTGSTPAAGITGNLINDVILANVTGNLQTQISTNNIYDAAQDIALTSISGNYTNNATTATISSALQANIQTISGVDIAQDVRLATLSASYTNNLTTTSISASLRAFSSSGFRNPLINGDFMVDNRGIGLSGTTVISGWTLDQWYAQQVGTLAVAYSQDTSSASPSAGGYAWLKARVSTLQAAPAANDYWAISIPLEGDVFARYMFGTRVPKTIYVSFWIRSSANITFSVNLRNGTNDRNYVQNSTTTVVNQWQKKELTFVGDIGGNWTTTTAKGATLAFTFMAGASMTTATGAWSPNFRPGGTGISNAASALNNISIADVQICDVQNTEFERLPIDIQQRRCLRYFTYLNDGIGFAQTTTTWMAPLRFPATMRATPTIGTAGALRLTDGATNFDQSSASSGIYTGDATGGTISGAANFTGLVANRPYMLTSDALSRRLFASAELL